MSASVCPSGSLKNAIHSSTPESSTGERGAGGVDVIDTKVEDGLALLARALIDRAEEEPRALDVEERDVAIGIEVRELEDVLDRVERVPPRVARLEWDEPLEHGSYPFVAKVVGRVAAIGSVSV